MQRRIGTMRKGIGRWLGIGLAMLGLAWGLPTMAADTLTITGAGATFPYPLYSKWFYEYSNSHPGVNFNYQSIGSGGGTRQIPRGAGGPEGAAETPGAELGGSDSVLVRRSGGSGTTDIFTNYLNTVSAEWKEKVGRGKSVNWPVGLGGKGNEGGSGGVKQTPGAH